MLLEFLIQYFAMQKRLGIETSGLHRNFRHSETLNLSQNYNLTDTLYMWDRYRKTEQYKIRIGQDRKKETTQNRDRF